VHVAEAERLQLFLRPRDRALVCGRVREARADHRRQVIERLEHLRVFHALDANLFKRAHFLRGKAGAERCHTKENDGDLLHGRILLPSITIRA